MFLINQRKFKTWISQAGYKWCPIFSKKIAQGIALRNSECQRKPYRFGELDRSKRVWLEELKELICVDEELSTQRV